MRRRANLILAFLGLGLCLLGLSLLESRVRLTVAMDRIIEERRLVRSLGLTDLALFTEARYSRHPSVADRHAPFQDYPLSFDHFPSGSLIPPRLD